MNIRPRQFRPSMGETKYKYIGPSKPKTWAHLKTRFLLFWDILRKSKDIGWAPWSEVLLFASDMHNNSEDWFLLIVETIRCQSWKIVSQLYNCQLWKFSQWQTVIWKLHCLFVCIFVLYTSRALGSTQGLYCGYLFCISGCWQSRKMVPY